MWEYSVLALYNVNAEALSLKLDDLSEKGWEPYLPVNLAFQIPCLIFRRLKNPSTVTPVPITPGEVKTLGGTEKPPIFKQGKKK